MNPTPEAVNPIKTEEKIQPEVTNNQVAPTVEQTSATVDQQEDPNWKAFREARKRDREEREAAERKAAEKDREIAALKAAMEAALARPAPAHQSSPYDEVEETEEQRIEKKIAAVLEQREQAARRAQQERERQEMPQRLQAAYPDFNKVMSQENLDYFEFHFPEIARPLNRLPDGFDKWADVYHAIKKVMPNALHAKQDAARAQENAMRPKSMSSTGASQAGETSPSAYLSEERKAANWARMQRLMKGA